jgi:threonine/homoserine/homoserine lactone efflux protein
METFLSGFGLALAICASPGAVTTQAVRNGLERGFSAALSVQVGALAGMSLWSGIGLMGAALLTENLMIRLAVGSLGILLILWLMAQALRDAIRIRPVKGLPSSMRSDFALGVGLSLANPLPIALWLGLGSSIVLAPTPITILIFFLGLVSSALLWSVFLAALTAWGRRFVTPRLLRLVSLICGLALGLFAIRLAFNIIQILEKQ